MMVADEQDGFTYRNALADWDHVSSDLMTEGSDWTAPLATIAIPTYGRPDFLAEAVQSLLDQDFDRPFEIIVVDNDPLSAGADLLLQALPKLRHRSFRYFRNRQNIGLFPNWNRCIQLSRGVWTTVLNDDDLLDFNYLSLMFAEINRRPAIDGLASRKRLWNENHPDGSIGTQDKSLRLKRHGLFSAVLSRPKLRGPARKVKLRAREEYLFLGQASRRITAQKFFWGSVLGNSAGFLFRREAALAVGGFYPEEHPSADYWFYVRFALRHHLRQHRAEAATIRITGENVTSKSVVEQLQQGSRLQRVLAGTVAPRWWLRYLPLMLACAREGFNQYWNSNVSTAEVETALGFTLPPADYRRLDRLRLFFRAE